MRWNGGSWRNCSGEYFLHDLGLLDTGEFHIGVAEYFAKAHGEGSEEVTPERSRQRVEESNLFIEEAHIIYSRMAGSQVK